MTARPLAGSGLLAGALAAYWSVGRPWHLRWGATAQECAGPLPGDELIADADLLATRAITIHAPADQVWPWIAQLGQGRGGFYSYDLLENLVGCDIHSAARVVPQWQDVAVGDRVMLAPRVGLDVALLDRGRSLVLRGAVPLGGTAAPYDFTWAFVLRGEPGETTRLLVRERYGYTRPWAALLVEPAEGVSFLMSRGMLRGIRRRAQSAATAPRDRRPAPGGAR
ncbi:hypothetical protein KGA66_22725 [Actinocrinis puniceicyclus]|uniref:SRPBCC family protein n=1 Tax=Actinocrinis puniceicyclus TaxID=977794 RepID=A0A8J7WNW3_9ACTN|nr:hypothetical protein [Actinocrinis puniceicyclus]MBS2965881.1 hypothetical protein [Actinocrinis puniceicyclus]